GGSVWPEGGRSLQLFAELDVAPPVAHPLLIERQREGALDVCLQQHNRRASLARPRLRSGQQAGADAAAPVRLLNDERADGHAECSGVAHELPCSSLERLLE